MTRIAVCAVSAALAFAWTSGSARAGDNVSEVPGQPATASEIAHGQVQGIDNTRHVLTLSNGQQLALDPNAPVTKDGKDATLKDIQQGDDVWASFTPGSSPMVEGLDAETPARVIMDEIPSTNQQQFVHETWTSSGG